MKYLSVRDYFIRLQNAGNILILFPLFVFLSYYVMLEYKIMEMKKFLTEGDHLVFWYFFSGIIFFSFLVFKISKSRMKIISAEVSLGIKLEKLGNIYLFRLWYISCIAMMTSGGLFIWGDGRFGMIFIGIVLFHFFTRPTPNRVIRHLNLKGDEREMIESKGDSF